MADWDSRFLSLAELVSGWSKDRTQCGAVIARPDRTVASIGFNGFPRGCDDDPSLYLDQESQHGRVVHAELNAVLNAYERLAGYTVYSTKPVCDRCTTVVIQAGIVRVVFRAQPELEARWAGPLRRSADMCQEAGVELVRHSVPDAHQQVMGVDQGMDMGIDSRWPGPAQVRPRSGGTLRG